MKYSIVLISLVALFSTGQLFAQHKAPQTFDRVDPRPFADNANHWYKGMDDKRMINPLPRNGYQWYTYAPQKVLAQYASWQKKIGAKP